MAYGRCPTCGEYGFLDAGILEHRCKSVWEARVPEWHDEDEWGRVHARDAEQAAERMAQRYDDEGDQTLSRDPDQATIEVMVRDPRTAEISTWACRASLVVEYHARRSGGANGAS